MKILQLGTIVQNFDKLMVSGAETEKIAQSINLLSGAQQSFLLSTWQLNPALAAEILEINGVSTASEVGTIATTKLTTAQIGLGTSLQFAISQVKILGKEMLTFVASNPILLMVAAATAAIVAIDKAADKAAEVRHKVQAEQAKKEEEHIEQINKQTQSLKESLKSLQEYIDTYEQIGYSHIRTAEEVKTLTDIQTNLRATYGGLANDIDLVNGKYDEEIQKLRTLQEEETKRQSYVLAERYHKNRSQLTTNHSSGGNDYYMFDGVTDSNVYAQRIAKEIGGFNFFSFNGKNYLQQKLGNIQQTYADAQRAMDIIAEIPSYLQEENRELIQAVTEHYFEVQDAYNNDYKLAQDYADVIIHTFSVDGINFSNVTKETYEKWRNAMITAFHEDDDFFDSVLMDSVESLFNNIETIVPEFSFSSWFEANDIEEVEKQINKLKDIVKSVYDGNDLSGEQRALLSDLGLDGMIDDADKLADSVDKLTHEQLNDLSAELLELLKNAKSLDEHNAILGAMQYIDSLSQSTSEVKDIYKEQTEELKKQIKTTQANINNAKRRKEAEEQVLESLKKQKEVLENQIDQYEKAAQAVQDYIDDQINSLNKQKSAIEETYNKQIEALQDEADERERLNDLREKELALENAKNSKVRTYSAGGFAIVQDNSAIKQAQADYDKALNDSRIAQLEKERDEAIKPIEEQIKALEDYKDAWSEALHHYERVQNEMYAQTIFGSNWREAALSADANMVNSFVGVYDGLQNQLHNIVEPQIEQKERDIEAIDRQIESYEELKTNQQAYLDFFKNYSKDFSKAVGEQKKALEEFLNLVKQGKDQSGIFRAFDKVMQYFDTDYIPQFANGGTANFTGTAMLHGTANRAELILNNADAKKLYEVIHGSNIPQLTKSVIGNIFDTVKNQGMENISSANTNNNNSNNYYTWTVTGNNIHADSYTEFKENMDRFVRQSQMDLDVGKR